MNPDQDPKTYNNMKLMSEPNIEIQTLQSWTISNLADVDVSIVRSLFLFQSARDLIVLQGSSLKYHNARQLS